MKTRSASCDRTEAHRRSGSRSSRRPCRRRPSAVRATGGLRELLLVELVDAADIGQHDLAVDREDQALHDLADMHADRGGRVRRGLRAFRKPSRRDRPVRIPPLPLQPG